ncbi:MAG: GTP-binding protein [Promethearchaeota archaeon]
MAEKNKKKKIIHCGLFGHVDSGKTSVASVLSEIISTAGLDAHPQAKKRGISIDLGFTSFDIDDVTITLVDAPGHADLIRSVVASANIIDIGMIVLDARKGPEIQTGEHMVILDALGIKNVIFILNKIDALENSGTDPSSLEAMIKKTRAFLRKSGDTFANAPLIPVSAHEKKGFDELIKALKSLIKNKVFTRNVDGAFIMPFDHHFQVKGYGTVVTGSIIQGRVSVGDLVEISPLKMTGKVKSINIFKQAVSDAEAGDRVGVAITGIDNSRLFRGCMLCTPGSVKVARHLIVKGKKIPFFKRDLNFRSQVHVTVGMITVPAMFFPFRENNGQYLVQPSITSETNGNFIAYLYSKEPIPCNDGSKILISRLDLPPQELRIAAKATIEKIIDKTPAFFKVKKKIGYIKDQSKGIIEGFARDLEGARIITGRNIYCKFFRDNQEHFTSGTIVAPFGTKGNVKVKFDGEVPPDGSAVALEYPKPYKITL